MIKISVVDSSLAIKKKEQINTGSNNFYELQFHFNSTWDGYAKHAVFYQTSEIVKYEMAIDDTGVVKIPGFIIKADIPLYIGAYGSKDDVIISTNFANLPIFNGAYSGDLITPILEDIVRTVDTKINYIRENENGEFEYSTDSGETWNKVTDKDAYEEIGKRITEIETKLKSYKDEIDVVKSTYQPKLTAGKNIKIEDNVISAESEVLYIKSFTKANFVKNSAKGWYELSIPKTEYGIDNAYIDKAFLTRVEDNKGQVQVERETNFFYSYQKGDNQTIYLIVDIDLENYRVYNGRIIIKGE